MKMEYQRPTFVEVHLDHFTHNVQQIRNHIGNASIMPVIKANAYGHGILRVAKHLESIGVEQLGVAFLEEGIALRKAGITMPILILGGIFDFHLNRFLEYDLEITISSLNILKKVDEVAGQIGKKAVIHLKIDTGMERLGVRHPDASEYIEEALRCKNCIIKGVCSHLAIADEPDHPMTPIQIEKFEEAISTFDRLSEPMPIRHLANSGGILHFPESHYDMVRPGIIFYGVYPDPLSHRVLDVKPALYLKSHVVLSKEVPALHPVSYGASWQSDHKVNILTIPVGYGDGYRRDLSNKGSVLIRGEKYPIAGRVCMDQFMANTEDTKISEGEEVILIGKQKEGVISAEEIATLIGTIPYEILTGLNDRIPRVYV